MAESASDLRQRKLKARTEALMHKGGYFQCKAHQRRLFRIEKIRLERLERARVSPEERQRAWDRYRSEKPRSHAQWNYDDPESDFGDPEEELAFRKADEQTQLLYEQFEQEETEWLARYLDEDTAWCPMCEKSLLECLDSGYFACPSCGARLPRGQFDSPGQMEEEIFCALEGHQLRCHGRPQFLLTPAELGDVTLLMVCNMCSASLDISSSRISE